MKRESGEVRRSCRQKAIRISLIGDPNSGVARVRRALRTAKDFHWLEIHSTADDALKNIPSAKPRIVLVDLDTNGLFGPEFFRLLKAAVPETEVIGISKSCSPGTVLSIFMSGASGFLLESSPAAESARILREVADGRCSLSSEALQHLFLSFRQGCGTRGQTLLTTREQQIMAHFILGACDKEVATQLSIGTGTVHTHSNSIFKKLGVRSRAEAVQTYLCCQRSRR